MSTTREQPLAIARQADGRLVVTGDLLFAQAVAAGESGRQLISSAPEARVVVSLSGLARINSVSAAVLVEWCRSARVAGKTLVIEDVPPQLAGMLRLSGLDELLGIH